MIQNNTWSDDKNIAAYAEYGKPKPQHSSNNPHHIHLGPKILSTSWSNYSSEWWLFEYVGTSVKAYEWNGSGWDFVQDLFAEPGITEFTGSFDQNGRPLVFFNTGSELRLWWYDPIAEQNTTTVFGIGTNPFCTLDLKYGVDTEYSDVLLFYVRDNAIYYRVQRDRYAVEYPTPVTDNALLIKNADMAIDYRMQVSYRALLPDYIPPTPQPPTQPVQTGSWSYFLNGYQSVIDFRADMLQLNTEFSIGIQLDSVELDKPDIALWSHQIAQVEGYYGGMMAVSFTGQSHNVVRVLYGGRVFESLAPFQLQPGHWLSEVTTEPTGTYLTVSVKPSGQSGYISHRVKVSPNYESSEYSSLKIGAMSGTRGRMINCLRGSISAVTVVTPTYASGLKLAMDHNSYPETGLPGELQPILNTDGSPSGMDNAIIRDYRPQNWAFNPD
ncbi:TPA: hypothetical protein QDZ84_002500 [Shewanella algae]|uniref:hypothetical protein n=1 Tax=Shewanella algae TaxID=38313 RepID=UPI001C59EC8C|nr:hypothetical protein [Shewanella algae]HDS1207485.1 hypothetical protein [Shewanella algae]